jgi:hypothetical protein
MSETGRPHDGNDVVNDDVDEVLSNANPNPDRVGCPPKDTLIALARKALPLDHPGYEHMARCSPCYVEVRFLQKSMRVIDSRCNSSD